MKAHSETHFENENMFLENGKVIYPLKKKYVHSHTFKGMTGHIVTM